MVQHPRATRNGDTIISARTRVERVRFGHRVCSFEDAISISAKRVAKVDPQLSKYPADANLFEAVCSVPPLVLVLRLS